MTGASKREIARLPKVELHCHLEGTVSPELAIRLAKRNNMTLPPDLIDANGHYRWHDFSSFLKAYDMASACIKTPEDYRDIMYEYLKACAGEGAIYVEVFSSPDHAAAAGMDYARHLEGIVAGIEDAQRDFVIICRIIVTCVRHLGPKRAMAVARLVVAHPHPFVVGFGMAGDEAAFTCADFAPAFDIVANAGLQTTAHAGEIQGPASVRDAINALPVSRIGHGVRAMEDDALVKEIVARDIHLEVCPGSNLALDLYKSAAEHPLQRLIKAGCNLSLNSDDPPYFHTTIGQEYARAHTAHRLSLHTLQQITLNAINASFADQDTKDRLKEKL